VGGIGQLSPERALLYVGGQPRLTAGLEQNSLAGPTAPVLFFSFLHMIDSLFAKVDVADEMAKSNEAKT
jgi:hypothetical protein